MREEEHFFLPQPYFDDRRSNLENRESWEGNEVNEDKKVEVWPFLDWSLVQAGRIEFMDFKKRQPLASPQRQNIPYGISINSQRAKKTAFWLKAEKPWEAMRINIYLTVMYEGGIYRTWYESMGSDYSNDFSIKLCYAESTDGFNWKKPILNLIEYEGDKRTNIVFDKNSNGGLGYVGGTVFLDPAASSSERYKLIYTCGNKKLGSWNWERDLYQVRGAVSKDGVFWKPIPEPIMDNYMSDTQNVAYYDRKIGSYVGYFRDWIGVAGSGKRVIARAETKDFRKWPPPKTILSLGVNYHPSHGLYTNAHALYPGRDDLHLFFPAQYDREKDSLEVYLATSRDGVRWEYFGKNPVVALEEKGSGQEGQIYAGCGLVPLGEENLALPCCGLSTTHNYYLPGAKDYLGGYFWATWKKDRLIAIEADEEGSFSMPIITIHQLTKLYLNFTTKPAGEIRVQISEKGKPISGYTFSDCSPIRGDEFKYPLTWRGKTEISISEGKPVVVQFRMNQAKLFALYFER